MIDNPEIPDPQKAPSDQPEAKTTGGGDPKMNGNGDITLDQQKLIEWMKATDKELKIMRLTQLVLCGAVIMLLFTAVKPDGVSSVSPL